MNFENKILNSLKIYKRINAASNMLLKKFKQLTCFKTLQNVFSSEKCNLNKFYSANKFIVKTVTNLENKEKSFKCALKFKDF